MFSKEIQAGIKVSLETVQNKCCTTPVLAILASSKKKVKQVVNHVNYLIQGSERSPPTKDQEPSTSKVHAWLEHYDDPSTRSSGKRQEWDTVESTTLEKAFKNFPSLSSTAEIRGVLMKDTKLFEIMNREHWERLYTKIKNIFKKKSKT